MSEVGGAARRRLESNSYLSLAEAAGLTSRPALRRNAEDQSYCVRQVTPPRQVRSGHGDSHARGKLIRSERKAAAKAQQNHAKEPKKPTWSRRYATHHGPQAFAGGHVAFDKRGYRDFSIPCEAERTLEQYEQAKNCRSVLELGTVPGSIAESKADDGRGSQTASRARKGYTKPDRQQIDGIPKAVVIDRPEIAADKSTNLGGTGKSVQAAALNDTDSSDENLDDWSPEQIAEFEQHKHNAVDMKQPNALSNESDSPYFGPTATSPPDMFLPVVNPCTVCPEKCRGHDHNYYHEDQQLDHEDQHLDHEDQQLDHEDQQLDHEDQLLDLVVIGAGPHALSLLCRLTDDEPDLLGEIERTRMMTKTTERLNGQASRGGRKAERREGGCGSTNRQVRQHLNKQFDATMSLPKCMVVDSHGEWMAEWKQNFEALDIQTTRSHADFHPCPFDFKSLRIWAHQQNRENELYETRQLDKDATWTGRVEAAESGEVSFNKTPYVLPSTRLFNDFCDSLIARYNLDPLLRKGYVSEVKVVPAVNNSEPCTFKVHLADGDILTARKVVCAMGPGPMFKGMRPKLPDWVRQLTSDLSQTDVHGAASRVMHSQELVESFRQGNAPDANARILIIGGGQTAAHLALKAARSQCAVTVASRRNINVRPFDLPNQVMGLGDSSCRFQVDDRLGVLGRDRGDTLAKIHRRQPKERVECSKQLRGGGSVSPEVYYELLQLVPEMLLSSKPAPSSGPSFELPTVTVDSSNTATDAGSIFGSESDSCSVDSNSSTSSTQDSNFERTILNQCGSVRLMREVVVNKAGCNNAAEIQVQFDDGTQGEYDYIWLATGGNLNLHVIPLFKSLSEQWPIDIVDYAGSALPVLQPDLSWDVNCPLYILGAFAQIELGPDALNVAGARSGSVLVAKALMQDTKQGRAKMPNSRRIRYYM